MTDHENESEIEEIVNPSSDDKLYQMLAGRSTEQPTRSALLKEFKKKTPLENRTLTPDQAPNINHEFDSLNPGQFQCLWCKRIFKKEKGRLIHSYSCSWQPDKIEALSRMRLSRKEDKEKREEKLKRTVSSGSRLISASFFK